MYFKVIGWGDVEWILLVHDKEMWSVHINTLPELPGSIKCERNFCLCKELSSFSRTTCSMQLFCSLSLQLVRHSFHPKHEGFRGVKNSNDLHGMRHVITCRIPCLTSERFWVQTSVHRPAIHTDVSLTFTLSYPSKECQKSKLFQATTAFHVPSNPLFTGRCSLRRYQFYDYK